MTKIINIILNFLKYGLNLYLNKYNVFLILPCVILQFIVLNTLYKYPAILTIK